jgi:hypothetical protein
MDTKDSRIYDLINKMTSEEKVSQLTNSAAAIGQELMHKYECFKNVYQLSGKPAIFIANCAPKITVSPAFGEVQDVSGDLCSIDKNGSYTSVYRDFEGIPCGKPKILQNLEDINAYDMYYVYIDILSMKCKHSEERFPTIDRLGPNFLSKTMLINLVKHYLLTMATTTPFGGSVALITLLVLIT